MPILLFSDAVADRSRAFAPLEFGRSFALFTFQARCAARFGRGVAWIEGQGLRWHEFFWVAELKV